MSSRAQHVGSAPDSGIYTPTPTPADNDDLPTYINDELLRVGGIINGILEGGSLPPQSELPKRVREGMIIFFSRIIPDSPIDAPGVWLYKKAKWWKIFDDPSEIIDVIKPIVDNINDDLNDLNNDLDDLNNNILPQVNADLDQARQDLQQAAQDLQDLNNDLANIDGKFPISETEILDGAISTPKLAANAVTADKIVANSIGADKLVANSITGDKLVANSITGDKLVALSITGDKIAANSIAGDKIIANSIGADKIVANSITGGKISSATKITAGTGNASAALDGADSMWRIYAGNANPSSAPFRVDKDGNLYASTGNFGGTIHADKLEGDIVDIVTSARPRVDIPSGGQAGTIVWQDYANVNIPSSTFERTLKLDPIIFRFQDTVFAEYWLGIFDGSTEVTKKMINAREGLYVTSYPLVWNAPTSSKNYKIRIGREQSAAGGYSVDQDITITMFKKGSSVITIT